MKLSLWRSLASFTRILLSALLLGSMPPYPQDSSAIEPNSTMQSPVLVTPHMAEDVSGESSPPEPPTGDCSLYRIKFSTSYTKKKGELSVRDNSQPQLSCFRDLLAAAFEARSNEFDKNAYTINGGVTENFGEKEATWITEIFYDNILAHQQPVPRSRKNYQANKAFVECTGRFKEITHRSSSSLFGGYTSTDSNEYGCASGYFLMDENCQLKKISDVASGGLANLCGNLRYHSTVHTPVSLLWDGMTHESLDAVLANFPLDPQRSDATYFWKASSKAPLLVYDPQHTGEITSAFQLFGSWSFGGQSVASLLNANRPTPWANGYEALATLDTNHDGEISGSEIAPLGLWFDHNRDGISQVGEVKRLSDTGVTKLFYQPDFEDLRRRHLVVNVGYERSVNGTNHRGASVDWSVPGSRDAFDLVASKLLAQRVKDGQSIRKQPAVEAPALNPPVGGSVIPTDISGVWTWRLDMPTATGGHFVLDSDGNEIFGQTLLELGVKGLAGVSRIISFSSLSGSHTLSAEGQRQIVFATELADGAQLRNTALIVSNTEMTGTSVLVSPGTNGEKLTYHWKATRLP